MLQFFSHCFSLVFRYLASVMVGNPSDSVPMVISWKFLFPDKSLSSPVPSNNTIGPGTSQLIRIPVLSPKELTKEQQQGIVSLSAMQQPDNEEPQPLFLNGKKVEAVEVELENTKDDKKVLKYVPLKVALASMYFY